MKNIAIFIDAGYFYSSAVEIYSIKDHVQEKTRRDIYLSKAPVEIFSDLLCEIRAYSDSLLRVPKVFKNRKPIFSQTEDYSLYRIYWYDALYQGRMSDDHNKIIATQKTTLRTGVINRYGVQKGVDTLICLDMMEIAYHHTVDIVYLFTGDEDFQPLLEKVRSMGLEVHLIVVGDPPRNVGYPLQLASDGVLSIPDQKMLEWAACRIWEPMTTEHQDDPTPVEENEGVTLEMIEEATQSAVREIINIDQPAVRQSILDEIRSFSGSIPQKYDRVLIAKVRNTIFPDDTSVQPFKAAEMAAIRRTFIRMLEGKI